jgi:hypothetical protein
LCSGEIKITNTYHAALHWSDPSYSSSEEEENRYNKALFTSADVVYNSVHGQDVQTFIDDRQVQKIIITVIVEAATAQHLRSKYQLAFHSRSFRV